MKNIIYFTLLTSMISCSSLGDIPISKLSYQAEELPNTEGGWWSTSGDFNGDHMPDFVNIASGSSSLTVFYGSKTDSLANPIVIKTNSTPFAVSSLGDINGDGFDDLLVAHQWGNNKTTIYYGSKNGLTETSKFIMKDDTYGFGHSIAEGSGDINNDGYDDIVVNMRGKKSPPSTYVYYGAPDKEYSQPDYVIKYDEELISPVQGSIVGDLNDDGYDEVVSITCSGKRNEYRILRIYYGSEAGISEEDMQLIQLEVYPVSIKYSLTIAQVNDVNNDGIDDLVLGNQFASDSIQHEGGIILFYGAKNRINNEPDAIISNPEPEFNVRFGSRIDGIGDINHDGFNDIIVGSPSAYKAFIFYGGKDGLHRANHTMLSGSSGRTFGWAVEGVGELFGNGKKYILIGEEFGTSFLYSIDEAAMKNQK
jgi:hypothetical protein